MTWRHIVGVAFCILSLLICGATNTCHDMVPALKDVVLVAIGGILGDANSQTKALRRKGGGPELEKQKER
jgi:hypothetical protein